MLFIICFNIRRNARLNEGEKDRVSCSSRVCMKCWGVLDDSSVVLLFFSPLLTSSSWAQAWHPPSSQHFFFYYGIVFYIPSGPVLCGRAMSAVLVEMWRWTLFSFVICCSHTPEGHLNMVGWRSYDALCRVDAVMARCSPVSWCKWDTQQRLFRPRGMHSALTVLQVSHCMCVCKVVSAEPLRSLNT